MASQAEYAAMRRALALAGRGLGTTSPNPVVGAVVLDIVGTVVGEGFHVKAGGPHAEVLALAAAGPRAQNGTCVVTLEPCNHTGRTPPCVQALLDAGIARVVVAVRDPFGPAAGGVEALRAAGLEVEVGVLAAEAERVNEAWLTSVRTGRPFVTWKYAASLDGRSAAVDGTSQWITGPAARADVHRLRAECDAVIVGSGTVLADDPALTVRDAPVRHGQPLRVVLDSGLRTPPTARVLDDTAPTLIFKAPGAVDGDPRLYEGAKIVTVPQAADGTGVDLHAVLAELHSRQVVSVLLEGGPRLAGSFLAAGLVDRVVGYVAPVLIGGDGLPALAGPGAPTIEAARRFRLDEITPVGPDVRLVARPVVPSAPREPAVEN
ncbi:bifunctional diaminohydroxyphosphoribosylaminopyrimidine deaminase/5-amino-6-(5-phosphoribosylamino)uracil reductase RibD [Sporichthya brevicatena]|uniref:Riboflavin biosynthesis protein RibD n=1 Tax=Sporichthya brevicatena TaxID=171442 RepID=A0ABP3S4Z3_9ACTN